MCLTTQERLNIYTNLSRFLNKFSNSLDADFVAFRILWQQEDMCVMWKRCRLHSETMQATACALHVAKRALCELQPNGDALKSAPDIRAGALFLLYVVYFQQPTREYVKITVAPQTWQQMCRYVSDANDQAKYIFDKLVQSCAFRYTHEDYDRSFLGDITDYAHCRKPVKDTSLRGCGEETASKLEDVQYSLREIDELQKLYNEVKAKVSGSTAAPVRVVSTINSDISKAVATAANVSHSAGVKDEAVSDDSSETSVQHCYGTNGYTRSIYSKELPSCFKKEYLETDQNSEK